MQRNCQECDKTADTKAHEEWLLLEDKMEMEKEGNLLVP